MIEVMDGQTGSNKQSRCKVVMGGLNGDLKVHLSDSPVETTSVLKVLRHWRRHSQPSYLCNASALSKLFFFTCLTKTQHLETQYLYLPCSQFFCLFYRVVLDWLSLNKQDHVKLN